MNRLYVGQRHFRAIQRYSILRLKSSDSKTTPPKDNASKSSVQAAGSQASTAPAPAAKKPVSESSGSAQATNNKGANAENKNIKTSGNSSDATTTEAAGIVGSVKANETLPIKRDSKGDGKSDRPPRRQLTQPPINVSPLIRMFRWSFLTAGILYGFFRRRHLAKIEEKVREEKARKDIEIKARMVEEKRIRAENEAKALAILSQPVSSH